MQEAAIRSSLFFCIIWAFHAVLEYQRQSVNACLFRDNVEHMHSLVKSQVTIAAQICTR